MPKRYGLARYDSVVEVVSSASGMMGEEPAVALSVGAFDIGADRVGARMGSWRYRKEVVRAWSMEEMDAMSHQAGRQCVCFLLLLLRQPEHTDRLSSESMMMVYNWVGLAAEEQVAQRDSYYYLLEKYD